MRFSKHFCWSLGITLLVVFLCPLLVHSEQEEIVPLEEETSEALSQRRIGAPQVLEIPVPPVQKDEVASEDLSPALPAVAAGQSMEQSKPVSRTDPLEQRNLGEEEWQRNLPNRRVTGPRNYLGVLYATSEGGPTGVKVLDVVPGSPAQRAGFQGANHPPDEGQSKLIKAAIVVLAMSPVGPVAIPLAIAHDMYMNRQLPGDVIVSVDNQPVRDAQEFTNVMRRYKPRDTVSFSILRGGKPMQISVQLEEEPG